MLYFLTTQEQQMQNSVVLESIPWLKVGIILTEGAVAGSLVSLFFRQPGESVEIVVAFALFGVGIAWTITDFVMRLQGRHDKGH